MDFQTLLLQSININADYLNGLLYTVSVILTVLIYFRVKPLILRLNANVSLPFIKKYLYKNFPYYQKLYPEARVEFAARVQYFIATKTFIGRGLMVTRGMKTLIGASAIQITYGLPEISFQHFAYIIIYKDRYYNHQTQKFHRGEVNPSARSIVLTWKNFKEGYLNNRDSRNLGIHEMAHALLVENGIFNEDYGFLSYELLEEWNRLAPPIINKIKEGHTQFFRSYAATDEHELFAVAVENFFENPQRFKAEEPALYELLKSLLNQDPENP